MKQLLFLAVALLISMGCQRSDDSLLILNAEVNSLKEGHAQLREEIKSLKVALNDVRLDSMIRLENDHRRITENRELIQSHARIRSDNERTLRSNTESAISDLDFRLIRIENLLDEARR